MNVSDAGVPVGLAAYEERSIPAEEQNAGRIVDYFYRMEFHITPRFFSDSNYLFFFANTTSKKWNISWVIEPYEGVKTSPEETFATMFMLISLFR